MTEFERVSRPLCIIETISVCVVGAVDKGSHGTFPPGIKLNKAGCAHQIETGGEPCIYTYIKMACSDSACLPDVYGPGRYKLKRVSRRVNT